MISDFSKDVVMSILRSIYNPMKTEVQNPLELYAFAAKYQILFLLDTIAKELADSVKIENVYQVLLFAHLHKLKAVKTASFECYFAAHKGPINLEELVVNIGFELAGQMVDYLRQSETKKSSKLTKISTNPRSIHTMFGGYQSLTE